MEWSTLLSTKKLQTEESEPIQFDNYPINAFEKDYNKIVSSAAFRRLQDKTQVFPLDKSDFVRTRLTHSIEVSTIARQLGIMISKNKTMYRPADIGELEAEGIPSVLLCAGLLHDLGNPPFGHFGETTIGEWFKNNLPCINYKGSSLLDVLSANSKQLVSDLEHFEGNAQALRILSKAQYSTGMNLSAAIIGTLVKYPVDSLSFDKKDQDIKKHKLGYFYAESEFLSKISNIVGTQNDSETIQRHPLTFLLEAADDIAYTTADLEDAFKKGLFSLDEFIHFFESKYTKEDAEEKNAPAFFSHELIKDLKKRRGNNHSEFGDSAAFQDWIVYARRWFMYVVTFCFSKHYAEIMSGNCNQDMFKNTNHSLSISILKEAMVTFVFNSQAILKLELSSQTILSFLLEKFVHAVLYLDYSDEQYKQTKADKKYLSIFPENYIQDYNRARTGDESTDLYLRLLMVTDYISGMTDSYARTLYRELSGIE